MLSKQFKDVLKIISERMTKNNIRWSVIGSTNCLIQGMSVIPNDLDIVVELKELEKMENIFKDYEFLPIKRLSTIALNEESAWEFMIKINDVAVQILGEGDNGPYVSKLIKNRFIEIQLDNLKIPCFTLSAESEAYSETNRPEKAKRIKEFLQTN